MEDGATPVPALAERFRLAVELAPALAVGTLATGGVREHHPVVGGTLEELRGTLIGGAETLLRRPDGVDVVEAVFLVRTADGALLRGIGTGYRTHDAPFAGTRLSLVWEVDEAGPHAALATRAWVAERPAGAAAYLVAEVL